MKPRPNRNLFLLPDQPEVHAQCIDNIVRLKPEAAESHRIFTEALEAQAEPR